MPEWLNSRVWQELETIEEKEKVQYITSVERIGIAWGRVEGEYRLLKRLLEHRFGVLPHWVSERLEGAKEDELEAWSEAVLTAPTLEAVFKHTNLSWSTWSSKLPAARDHAERFEKRIRWSAVRGRYSLSEGWWSGEQTTNRSSKTLTTRLLQATGAGGVIIMDPDTPSGKLPYFLQADASALTGLLNTIDKKTEMVNRMAHLSPVRTYRAQVVSAVAMETEFQILNTLLADKAAQLQLTEYRIFEIFCAWEGNDHANAGFEVNYPKHIGVLKHQLLD